MATRKKYSKEFKQDPVRLVTEQGYNQSEAGRNLGIDRGMLRRWIKEFQDDGSGAFRGIGKLTPQQEELRRLREENRRLQMEREVLKNDGPLRQKSRAELSVHRPREEGLSGEAALPSVGCEPQWVLRLPAAPRTGTRPGA
jgi:transposase